LSEAVIANWWRQGVMGGAKGQWDCITTFIREGYTEDLKKVSVPILVMNGEADQIVPYAASGARGETGSAGHAEAASRFIGMRALKLSPVPLLMRVT
jgi:pimeloyl-ACP methyl ester carboxylesterase